MSCPHCKRTDTDGLFCDDDHCREDKRLYASPEHDGRTVVMYRDGHRVDLSPRCWHCNAILSDDGICRDPDCPRSQT